MTTWLLAANLAKTELASAIVGAAVTFDVVDPSAFVHPTRVIVWSATYEMPLSDSACEIMELTGISGDTFTVTRAQESTSQSDHDIGDNIAIVPTAAMWEQLQDASDNSNHLDSDTDRWYSGAADDMEVGYDGTVGVIKTDAVAASDLDVYCGAAKTLRLDTGVYDDFPPSPIISARLGSSAPTLATFVGNIEQYTFDATNDYVIGSTEIPHGYEEGQNLDVHIHWATNGTEGTAKYVKWQLEYTVGNPDGTAPYATTFGAAVTLNPNIEIPASTPDRAHIITSLGTITGTALKIGAYICWRLSRVAATGTAPANDPFAIAIGFHAPHDTLGSRQLYTK